MRELVHALATWRREERRFAVATVVSVDGSAPRPIGSGPAGVEVKHRGGVLYGIGW